MSRVAVPQKIRDFLLIASKHQCSICQAHTIDVHHIIAVSDGGTNSFQISSDNQNAGFDTYVAPPNTNPMDVINGKVPYYVSCSRNNMISYGNTCNVESGSYLIVNNPYRILGGNNQNIHITITELNPRPNYDMMWDPTVQTLSLQEYNRIYSLFHGQ